tara:strand:+ start:410 stop:1318 length:909 start_codon:yes stop_codon:yes gene_type:complete
MFAVQTAGSIFQHGQQTAAVRARNRAKLANFNAENEAYIADTILNNTQWKNTVQSSEVAIDNIFTNAAKTWETQDLEMDAIHAKHAFNTVDILKEMYKNEYAGEQTGVTAGRLAGASVRDAGMALTKSVRDVLINEDKSYMNKEIATIDANAKMRDQWEQVRQSPIPGQSPVAPEYEAGPSTGALMMNIAMNAAGSYLQGTKMNLMKQQTNAMTNMMNQATKTAGGAFTMPAGVFNPTSAINRGLPSAGSMFASSTPSLNLGFTSDLVNRASLAVAPNMFTQAGQRPDYLGAFNITSQSLTQ